MTDLPAWHPDDLEPDTTPAQSSELWSVAAQLARARPSPGAALRASVHAWARGMIEAAPPPPRPRGLWLRVGALATPGAVLLALVAIGLTGAGPFAR